jgi:hypothetical protein
MKIFKTILLFALTAGGTLSLQAQTLQRIVASPFESGSPAVMRIEWQQENPVTVQWKMGILLPVEFDRSQLLLAASRSINGGFTVANRGDTLWVKRSGSGDRITTTGALDLAIASIRLPADLQRPYPFSFTLVDSSRQTTFSGTMTISRDE